jgi:beta-glucosidase
VDIEQALSLLTLDEKIRLLTGEDFWSTYAISKIGLRKMVLSDGPTGVRGALWDERDPSLSLPSATCMAATWDRDSLELAGRLSAAEARRKGVDVVLGPTINLHRSPLGGRHFECYSEDPVLTGELAAAYVRGTQKMGVGACPKHYVANDTENDRFNYDAIVDEQTLRELYLAPFERAVTGADPWMLMSSYNTTNGHSMSESPLLQEPLKGEWGFSGVVVSDWTAVRTVEKSASSAQDLAMPGPDSPWSQGLAEAVASGAVPESAIDEKVRRLLKLASRVGALNSEPHALSLDSGGGDARAEIRGLAVQGMVLAKNDGTLPFAPGIKRIAVIGSHALDGRIMGGGSATVLPFAPVSPLEGLRSLLGDDVQIDFAAGTHATDELQELPISQCHLADGTQGIALQFLDSENSVYLDEVRFAGKYVKLGSDLSSMPVRVVARTRFTAANSGIHRFGGGGTGTFAVKVNGQKVHEGTTSFDPDDVLAALLSPPQTWGGIEIRAGESVDLELEYHPVQLPGWHLFSMLFGYQEPRQNADAELLKAIATASKADVVVVVVGTTEQVESEGYDRRNLQLPGRQDELVSAVVDANPNTVVVVNAGGPVEMPWFDDVAATILAWFPGEEFGNALADILTGAHEPGGRMPTTWGRSLSDAAVRTTDPVDGRVEYSEGLNIGYRSFAAREVDPLLWFGAGLGYTTWQIEDVSLPVRVTGGSDVDVAFTVRNTGHRHGSHVVQIYLERPDSAVRRPSRWLAGFMRVSADPQSSVEVTIRLDGRRFQHWADGWQNEAGAFNVYVAHDSALQGSQPQRIEIVQPS